ncbi:MAG TPA: metallophosphoesterase [Candidatus Limnocylindrales bacterium]
MRPLTILRLSAVVVLLAGCASSSVDSPVGSLAPVPGDASPAPSATHHKAPASPRPGGGVAAVKALPAPSPGSVVIAAAGDIACDPAADTGAPKACDQAGTAALILAMQPNAVLTLGDTQYEDNELGKYAVFDQSWGRFKDLIHPTIGNHEYLTSGASGYFDYFGAAAGDPTKGYYSYDLGSWHIVSLNSECSHIGGCGPGSPQEAWLQADLAAHPTACTLAYWHEPRWSSGEHGDAVQMATIWSDLVAAHVDIVLSGHNHDYERFAPLDASGQPSPDGVQEFVVGTGGKNHYGFVQPALAGEQVRDSTSFGVLRLVLGDHSYRWDFVPAASYHFTDSGSASCR